MGKKKFEDVPYNPLEAQMMRDAARVKSKEEAEEEEAESTPPTSPLTVVDGKRKPPPRKSEEHIQPRPISALPAPRGKAKLRRLQLTDKEEDQEVDDFVTRLQRLSGTKVSLNILLHAGIAAQIRNEEHIEAQIRKSPPPQQPSTSDSLKYAEFEDYWINIIDEALKKRPR